MLRADTGVPAVLHHLSVPVNASQPLRCRQVGVLVVTVALFVCPAVIVEHVLESVTAPCYVPCVLDDDVHIILHSARYAWSDRSVRTRSV